MWKKLKEAEIGQLKVGRGGGAVVSVITSIPTFWVRMNHADAYSFFFKIFVWKDLK